MPETKHQDFSDLTEILRPLGFSSPEEVEAAREAAREIRRRQAASLCPVCQGYGWTVGATEERIGTVGLAPCACTLRAWRERYLASLPDCDLALVQVDEYNQQAVTGAREYAARRGLPWLMLAGPTGRGKTHLAAGILRARAMAEPPQMGVFRPTVELLDWLKDGMDEGAILDCEARVRLACSWPLLLLDDLGAHQRTEWSWAKLEQILDARYRARLETIVTLETTIGLPDRMRSRLEHHLISWCFTLGGPDRRQG